eukprot:4761607-Pleurochrysis_carterae.AAC.1
MSAKLMRRALAAAAPPPPGVEMLCGAMRWPSLPHDPGGGGGEREKENGRAKGRWARAFCASWRACQQAGGE